MKRRWSLGLVVGLAALVPGGTHGQEPIRVPFEGTEVFAQVLHFNGLEPLRSESEWTEAPPSETLVIFFGHIPPWPERLQNFHDRGGAILIASDEPAVLPWNVNIAGSRVLQDPKNAYQNFAACPLLVDGFDRSHALFKNFSPRGGLATNGPSFLQVMDKSMPVLATFPRDCRIEARIKIRLKKELVYMAGRDGLLILAGQGVFFNGMMLQKDTDNLRFALNCVDWLAGTRKHVFFLENGVAKTSFALPLELPSLPAPPLPPEQAVELIMRFVEARVRDMERENFFNNLVYRLFGRETLLRAVLLFASLLMLIYGGARLVRSRFWLEKGVPLVIDPLGKPPPPLPPLEARQQWLAATGNYAELAQVLVRQWFWQHAHVDPVRWEQDDFQLPNFTVDGPWWQRWRHAWQIRHLETLGRNTDAISSGGLRKIRRLLRTLTEGGQISWSADGAE